jgi:type II secretory pathway pseudopilin PulG
MTLAEAAIALLVLAVASTSALSLASAATKTARRASELREANRIADAVLAWHERLPFEDPTIPGGLGAESGETSPGPSTWDDLDDANAWSGPAPTWFDPSGRWTLAIAVTWVSTADAAGVSVSDTGLKCVSVSVRISDRTVTTRRAVYARPRRRAARPPRGTAHIAALGFALLMITIALGALFVSRAVGRLGRDLRDASDAERRLRDGTAWAMLELENSTLDDGVTRRTFNMTSTASSQTLRAASSESPAPAFPAWSQPVRLTFQSTSGIGRRSGTADANPVRRPFSALERPVAVAGAFGTSGSGSLTVADGVGVVTSSRVAVPAGVVNLSSFGSTLQESLQRRAALVRFPTIAELTALSATGTALNYDTISKLGSRILLSPRHTLPSGAYSPRGVYVLDCANRTIDLEDMRVVGTLILLNPGAGSRLRGGLVFEPAVLGHPALVVVGSIEIEPTTLLRENSGGDLNFNPGGLPYPYVGGATDSDVTDAYPSRFNAPVIVTGSLQVNAAASFRGVCVGGDFGVAAGVSVARDPWIVSAPPDALCERLWAVDPSTVRRTFVE